MIVLYASSGLWGVVNNAGILGGLGPLEMLTIAHVEECVDVNLYGMIRVTKAFLPLLRKSRGRIVNASSMVGRSAFSFLPYSVSKYGVEAFSDRLRYYYVMFTHYASRIRHPPLSKPTLYTDS